MAETFRRSKIEKYVARLKVRKQLHEDASFGSEGYGRHEVLKEIISELEHEFNLKEEKK